MNDIEPTGPAAGAGRAGPRWTPANTTPKRRSTSWRSWRKPRPRRWRGRLSSGGNRPTRPPAWAGGRLEELRLLCENAGIDLVIFDCELSATQLRNLEDVCPAGW